MHVNMTTLAQIFFLSRKPVTKRRTLALKQLVKSFNKQVGVKKSVKEIIGFTHYVYGRDWQFRDYIYKCGIAR